MKVVVSVQAKRGSSRGLVHYISHSKIDHEREPEKGRELFNRFADNLSVESANNSLKNDTSRKRPGNDQLHHLVLSFRREDFAKFGHTDGERRKAVKEITRAALGRLEEKLNADRLAWAAAVHLNTANPHVHIALRKTYFTHDFEEKVLAKIPREAVPHNIKTSDRKKEFVQGYLAEGAAQKMDEIIERTLARPRQPEMPSREQKQRTRIDASRTQRSGSNAPERKLLRDWLLLKYELRSSEERVSLLMQHGHRTRFVVDDASLGKRHRRSLHDIDARAEKRALIEAKKQGIWNPREVEILKRLEVKGEQKRNAPAIRQIHAILRDLVTKEEANRARLHNRFKQADKEVNKIRAEFRRADRKLPVPSLSKDEIDRLQEQALSMNDIRGFGYLERVREELTGSREIAGRDARDLGRLSIQKAIFQLRSAAHQKDLKESRANRYSRVVQIDGTEWSIQRLDKREKERTGDSQSLGRFVSRFESFLFGGKSEDLPDREEIKDRVMEKLDTEDRELTNLRDQEAKKQKMLEKILDGHRDKKLVRDTCDLHQLTELESLSSRLKAADVYKKSWNLVRQFIERADTSCAAAKTFGSNMSPESFQKALDHEKTRTLAGRALAKEIVSRIQLAEANENLERFSAVKRFHKFEIKDPRSGTREFVCLNDVETNRGSFLDQAVDRILESKQQRQTRRLVKTAATQREDYLKSEVGSAIEMVKAASQAAAEYKDVHFFGLKTTTDYKPIFTASELSFIERRIDRSGNRSEIKSLEKTLSAARENRIDSLGHLLKDFTPTGDHVVLQPEKTREAAPAQVHQHDRVKETQREAARSQDRTHDRGGMIR